jgi:hypothetical protein
MLYAFCAPVYARLPMYGCRYRLLCAEREDKAGDKWRQEMQEARKRAFDRKRSEPQLGVGAPARQQQRLATEGGAAASRN